MHDVLYLNDLINGKYTLMRRTKWWMLDQPDTIPEEK